MSGMMALPRPAPPTRSSAQAVVTVNSSMFAWVPGLPEREAIDALISAYGTSTTRETACTTGSVACPPPPKRREYAGRAYDAVPCECQRLRSICHAQKGLACPGSTPCRPDQSRTPGS